MAFSLPRLLSKLQSIITLDTANNNLVLANSLVFPDGTKQTTAGVAVDAFARTTANGANGLAQGAYNQANVTIGIDATQNTNISIIQGVDLTQNTNITTANNAAWAAFAKANNALANTTGTFAGDLTVTGNVTVSNIYGTSANTSIVAGTYTTTFDNAGKLTLPGLIVFADATTQNTAFTGNAIDFFARTTANGANGLAAGAYAQANVTIGVDTTQNTRLQSIETINTNQNTTIAIIQSVDLTQNTRLDGIEGTNLTQNTNITTANNAAWAAYAAGNTNAINITAVNQFAQSAYNQANVTVGVDATQNSAISIIQSVDLTQNTNITAVNQFAQSAYNTANTKFNSSGGNITGSVTISGNNDLTVTGNLYITGTQFVSNTASFATQDPLLVLGVGNYISDVVDIGFAGHYNDGTNAHSGLIRDAGTKEYYFFKGYTPELDTNNNVNINHASFSTANVNASYFKGNVVANTVNINGKDWQSVSDTQNTSIGIIQGVDLTQNSNISIIQGVDLTQNTRLDGIEGTNFTQNTNITTANNAAWAAFAYANTRLANTGSLITVNGASQLYVSNTTASTSNTTGALTVAGGIGVLGNVTSGGVTTNNVSLISGSLIFSGPISAPAWTTSGIRHVSVPNIITDTTSTGVVPNAYTNNFGGNTIAASNPVTYTNYATIFVNNPNPGTNVIFTNPYSLITAGNVNILPATVSTSNITGALIVGGGVGVKGNVATDGIIFADGTRQTTAASGTGGGGSSSSLASWTVINSNYTVGNNIQLLANSTGGTFTITLPASPVTSNVIVIADGSAPNTGWSNNNVLVNPNGRTIEGINDTLALNISQSSVSLIYDGATWQVVSSTGPKGDTGSTGPAGATGNTGPAGVGSNATQRIYRFNATNNQTIFVGSDAYSQTLSYNVNALSVYLNGVFLRPTEDYFANNGTTITLTSGSFANDALDVITFQSMSLTAAQNTITTYTYTASNNQTSFGGTDINGLSLNYNPNNLFVTLNGLTLRNGTDYLQTNTSFIQLTSGALANDEVSIVAFGSFNVQGQNTQNTISTYYYTSTAGQTTFSGTDIYGNSLSYMQDGLIVVRNGSTLRNKIDYTATNGTSVSLANPSYANDEIAITAFGNFSVAANGYTQVQSNNLFLTKTDANNIFATTANTYTQAQANTKFATTGKAIAMAIVFGG